MNCQGVYCQDPAAEWARELCQQFSLPRLAAPQGWHLVREADALVLRNADMPKQGDILVDFASGAATYRRKFGGGKSEGIARPLACTKKQVCR